MEVIENRMVVGSHCYPMRKVRLRCSYLDCEREIYEGDNYYDFDGEAVCEGCVHDYVRERYRRCAE